LLKFSNADKPLSHWTNADSKLFGQYTNKLREMEQRTDEGRAHGAVTFDQLVDEMGLNADQRLTLQRMLSGVVQASNFTPPGGDEDGFDYTSLAKQIPVETLDPDQRKALEAVADGLGPWEKAVFDAFVESHPADRGWKTEVARKNVNPDTGLPYTRPAPALALKRISEKVLEVYEGPQKAA
jgi:hypothetical protein